LKRQQQLTILASRPLLGLIATVAILVVASVAPIIFNQPYFYYVSYIVLQYVILATAWNIFGGYAGYVNFGAAGFFGLGAYVSGYLYHTYNLGLLAGLVAAAAACAALGALVGYATARLRGLYFAIATLAISLLIQVVFINMPQVGQSFGFIVTPPPPPPPYPSYIAFLFPVMIAIALISVLASWFLLRSRFGIGLFSIKDDELAAESVGVPTFKLKLLAATMSGLFMGLAGAPFPYYQLYISPDIISFTISINSVAMPLIGGIGTLSGPVVGAVLLSAIQQVASVSISSDINVLIVGVLIIIFIVAAPDGLLGIFRRLIGKPSTQGEKS